NITRQRFDQVNSTFFADAELNSWINMSVSELYDRMVNAYGEDYFAKSTTFNTVANTDTYSLSSISASDFYKLLDVLIQTNTTSGLFASLHKQSRTDLFTDQLTPGWQFSGQWCSAKYRLVGDNLIFAPKPSAVHSMKVWYIPVSPILVLDSDTF